MPQEKQESWEEKLHKIISDFTFRLSENGVAGFDTQELEDFIRSERKRAQEEVINCIPKEKDDFGGRSEFANGKNCKWCGVGEIEYHKATCPTLIKTIYNQCIEDFRKNLKDKGLNIE